MSEAAKKVSAREKARQRVAAQREAQRRRDEANEADLVAILKAGEVHENAATKRAKAIERAEQTYRDAVADAEATIDARISAMRERGETVADIADLTELTEADVRRHISAHKKNKRVESASDTPEPGETVGADDDPGTGGSGEGEREALGESVGEPDATRVPVSVGSD